MNSEEVKANGNFNRVSSSSNRQGQNNRSKEMVERNRFSNSHKMEWDGKQVPYDWKAVLGNYCHFLTKFETSEVKEYQKIYYIGHRAKKKEKIELYDNGDGDIGKIEEIEEVRRLNMNVNNKLGGSV